MVSHIILRYVADFMSYSYFPDESSQSSHLFLVEDMLERLTLGTLWAHPFHR